MPKSKKSPEALAIELLQQDPDISIRRLQGCSGLSYNKSSLLKNSYHSKNKQYYNTMVAGLVQRNVEEISELHIAHELAKEHHTFEVDDEKPIGIAFLADLHVGNAGTVHSLIRSDFDLIKKTDGMYALLGGDYTDNFLKSSMIGPIIQSPIQPKEQLAIFEKLLTVIEPKIIALISGNHDEWTRAVSGLSIIERLCEERSLVYAPHQLRVEVKLPGQTYAIGIRHQGKSNSSLNAGHAVKSWRRSSADWPFDIGCIGHTHESCVESFTHEGREHWAVRPGSYKIVDDFSRRLGFATALPVMPVVILYPKQRRIMAFSDLRSGAEALTALRALPESTRKTFANRVVK